MTAPAPPCERFIPPPNLGPPEGALGRAVHGLRRWLDLPVSSLYPHLRAWLAGRQGRVLEVGCGAQPYRHLLGPGCTYQGLDWQGVREVFGYQAPDTAYYDGGAFPFPDQSFDSLFSTEVLEHVYEVREFLGQCRRVLRPGGGLFISVPFQARYHYIPHDYWRFTPAALEKLLAEAGFQEVVVSPRGGDITVAAYKVVSLVFRWLRGPWAGKLAGVLAAPLGGLALVAGHVALWAGLGSSDDTLGYAVSARRPEREPGSATT